MMLFGRKESAKSTLGAKRNEGPKSRRLGMEALESRELLAVSALEYAAIAEAYSAFDLPEDRAAINLIEIDAEGLSVAALKAAIEGASQTPSDDLIVVRTTDDFNAIIYAEPTDAITIDFDAETSGALTIVSYGSQPLELDASGLSRVMTVKTGDVNLGGLTFENGFTEYVGGGVYVASGRTTLQNCFVVGNTASMAAGVYGASVVDTVVEGNLATATADENGWIDVAISEDARAFMVDYCDFSQTIQTGLTTSSEDENTGAHEIADDGYEIANASGEFRTDEQYDADKRMIKDEELCWAASAADMLWYTGWGRVAGLGTEDQLFQQVFAFYFPDQGYVTEKGVEWFINGTGSNTSGGGFYSDALANANDSVDNYFDTRSATCNVSGINELARQLQSGSAIGLSIGWYNSSNERKGGHAITCWGYVYDTSLTPNSPGYYKSLIVTDSDDHYSGYNPQGDADSLVFNIALQWNDSVVVLETEQGAYLLPDYKDASAKYGALEGFTILAQRPDEYATLGRAYSSSAVASNANDDSEPDLVVENATDSAESNYEIANSAVCDMSGRYLYFDEVLGYSAHILATGTWTYSLQDKLFGISSLYFRNSSSVSVNFTDATTVQGTYSCEDNVGVKTLDFSYSKDSTTYSYTLTLGNNSLFSASGRWGNKVARTDSDCLYYMKTSNNQTLLATPSLSVSSISTSSITVNFNSVPHADMYHIVCRPTNNSTDIRYYESPRTIGLSNTRTSYKITGLSPGVTYIIYLRAFSGDAAYYGSKSASVSAKTIGPLSTPVISSSSSAYNSVSIAWKGVSGAIGYELTCNGTSAQISADRNNFTFYGLNASTSYAVTLKALGDGKTATDSAERSKTVKTLASNVNLYVSKSLFDEPITLSASSSATLDAFTFTKGSDVKYNFSFNSVSDVSSTVKCAVYLDGSLLTTRSFSNVSSGKTTAYSSAVSLGSSLSTGIHTLRVVVDSEKNVAESNELDNSYCATFNIVDTKTIVVTTANDVVSSSDGFVSLREALAMVGCNGYGNRIEFKSSLDGSTITLSKGALPITQDVVIDASNLSSLTISGNNKSRVFYVREIGQKSSAFLKGLTITKGYSEWGSGIGVSGAGKIIVEKCAVVNNQAVCDSVGYNGLGGGIYTDSKNVVYLTNVLIANNSSTAYAGGALLNGTNVVITNSTIAGNTSANTGGVRLAGSSDLLNNSIVVSNTAAVNPNLYCSSNNDRSYNNSLVGAVFYTSISNSTSASYSTLFKNASNGDYALASGSYAIDKGNSSYAKDATGAALQYDLAGNARISGSSVDLGAYEYQQISKPNAPATVTATAQSSTSIRVGWNAVSNATSYALQYKQRSSSTWLTAQSSTTSNSYTIKNLQAGTQYDFRVSASNSSGTSSYATTSGWTTPDAPTISSATATSSTTISVAWGAVTGANSYTLEYKKDSDSSYSVYRSGLTSTSTTISGLTATTTYNIRVYAVGDGGNSAYSAVKTVTTSAPEPLPALSTPTISSASAASAKSINVVWGAVSNRKSYAVEYKLSSSSNWQTATTTVTSTSYTITGLSSSAKYAVRVKAIADGVNYSDSAYSTSKTAWTLPGAPTIASATATSSTTIDVAWNAVTGANSYTLEYKKDSDSSYSVYRSGLTSTSITVSGLTASTRYNFRVYAVGDGGNSSFSNVISATTEPEPEQLSPLSTPTISSATAASATSIKVVWGAVSNRKSYAVEYKLSSSSNWQTATSTATSTSYTISGLSSGTSYDVRVKAIGDGSNYSDSSYSTTKTAWTLPGAPAISSATATSSTTISVAWGAVTGANSYTLEYKKSADSSYSVYRSGLTSTSATVTGLTSNTTYNFRVKASGNGGESTYSGVKSATTEPEPTSLVVTTINDVVNANDGLVSLREALANATDGDTITFAHDLAGKTITLSDGELDVSKSVTIDAYSLWDSANVKPGITIDASQQSRVFYVNGNLTVSFKGLAITGGEVDGDGGGVYVESGCDATFENCEIVDNSASWYGGGVCADGDATFTNCTIANNSAWYGGGVCAYQRAEFTNCAIIGNTADNKGGGIYSYNSDFSDDEVFFDILSETIVNLTNSTVSGNSAAYSGGGICVAQSCSVQAYNSIVAVNIASYGADVDAHVNADTVACNTLSSYYEWTSGANNYVYKSSLPLFVNASAGNYELAANSQAIDKGNNAYAVDASDAALQYDLAGNARIVNGTVDLGAYEYQTASPLPSLSTPTISSATAASATSIKVVWGAVSNRKSYAVEYKLSSSSNWQTATSTATSTSYTISNLTSGTSYDVRVKALADGVNYSDSLYSAVKTAWTLPGAPTISSATATSSTTISVAWGAVTGANSYTLEYKKSSDSSYSVYRSGLTSTSTTVSGLTSSTTYNFRVKAVGNGGESTYSGMKSATTPNPVDPYKLATPNLSYEADATTITVKWDAVAGVKSYALAYKLSTEPETAWTTVSGMNSTKTSWSFEGVAGEHYDVRIRANGDGGATCYSSDYAYLYKMRTKKLAVLDFATSATSTSITAYWTEVSGAKSYTLQYKLSSATNWTNVGVRATETSYTVSGLTPNATYDVRLRANGDGGATWYSSDFCPTVSVKAFPKLTRPELATSATSTSITAYWDAISGAKSYTLQYKLSSATSWTNVGVRATEESYTIPGLTPGEKYDVRLRANGDGGATWTSSDFSATATLYAKPKFVRPELALADSTSTSITVAWTALSGAKSYTLQYRQLGAAEWTQQGLQATETSYTASGLTSNATYEFRVRANGDGGVNWYSSNFSKILTAQAIPSTRQLSAPTLSVGTTTANAINVSWTAVSGASGYQLQYKLSSANAWQNYVVTTTETTSTVSGLTSGASYDFRVKAVGDGTTTTDSVYSATVSGKTLAGKLAPPTLTVAAKTENSITVSWGAVSGAKSYSLEYKLSTSSVWSTQSATASATSATIANLTKGDYQLRMKANGDGGATWYSSDYSATVSVKLGAVLPTPELATSATSTSITAYWDLIEGAKSYTLQYKLASASSWTNQGVKAPLDSYTITGLTQGAKYDVRLRANGDGGATWFSSEYSATATLFANPKFVRPELTLVGSTNSSITVSWNALSGAKSYTLQYKLSNGSEWTNVGVKSTLTSQTVSGLTTGASYDFRLKANGDGGATWYSSDYSKVLTAPAVSRAEKLSTPTLSVAGSTSNSIAVSWNAISHASSYTLQYMLSTQSDWSAASTVSAPSTSTSVEISGLTSGKEYQIRVRANGDGGANWLTSDYSATVKRKTVETLATPELKVYGATESAIAVSWNAISGAKSYTLQYRVVGATSWTNAGVKATETTYTVAGLTSGSKYQFQLRANGDGGSTYYSSNFSAVLTQTAERKLFNPVLTTVSTETTITVKWDAIDGAKSYTMQYKASSETTWTNMSVKATETSVVFANFEPGVSYDFRLKANGDGGATCKSSEFSEVVSARIVGKLQTPTLSLLATTDATATVAWSAIENASSYGLYYRLVGESGWTQQRGVTADMTSATISDLTSGQTYEIRIKANGDGGANWLSSEFSAVLTVTIGEVAPIKLATPTLTVSSTDAALVATWTASPGATSYALYYRASGATSWTQQRGITADMTSYSFTTLAPGSSYDFQIRANGDGGARYLSSDWSTVLNQRYVAPLPTPVLRVTSLSVSTTNRSITLAWDAIENAKSYTLQYKLSSASTWTNVGVRATETSYTLAGLAAGTYDFRLRANGDGGATCKSSDYSAVRTMPLGTSSSASSRYDAFETLDEFDELDDDLLTALAATRN